MLKRWDYKCECTQCDWSATWTDRETWTPGAATKHADSTGHVVKAISIKYFNPNPKPQIGKSQPLETDKQTAYCEDCQLYIGVNGRFFFNAAWKAHVRKTKHRVTVLPNPNYKPETFGYKKRRRRSLD